MKIINFLEGYQNLLKEWKEPPTRKQFEEGYLGLMQHWIDPMIQDWQNRTGEQFYDWIEINGEEWPGYRDHVLLLNPVSEEKKLAKNIKSVEDKVKFKLEGEAILFGCFKIMDGYARFEQGRHRMFLGFDESYHDDVYINILTTHELTHVARESRESVWKGHGLSLSMTHDDFVKSQPVIEHLMGEGFSCTVSEALVPGEAPWRYCYQDAASYAQILQEKDRVNESIHRAIRDQVPYHELYRVTPQFAHYAWAHLWTKALLKEKFDGKIEEMVKASSRDFVDHALNFNL